MPYGIKEEVKELIRNKASKEMKVRKPQTLDQIERVMESVAMYAYSIGKHELNEQKRKTLCNQK